MTPSLSLRRCVLLIAALASFAATAQLKAPSGATASPGRAGLSAPPAAPAAASTADADKQQEQMEKVATLAAHGWLALLDRRDWGTAWDGSAAMFRASVPLGAWMDGVPKLREPMGALVDRQMAQATYRDQLEGRPAGDYVTVVFDAKFDKRPTAQEIVTTVREADGRWRVTGYLVK